MKKLLVILIIGINVGYCVAQPANDNCPGITLSTNNFCVPIAGTIAAATFSGFPASCGGLPNHDVFYNFVAAYSSEMITVTGCSAMDPVIHVYSGSCGGTTVMCINNTGIGAVESGTLTGLTVGNTYWLDVYDFYGNPSCSTFTICVSRPPPPTLVAVAAPTDVSCYGYCNGSAVGTWSGGYGPYSYVWTGPSSFTSPTLAISGLCAGIYTFTVTDSSSMTTASTTAIIGQSTPNFNILASNDTAFCLGGTATLNVNFTGLSLPSSCGLSTTSGCSGNNALIATVDSGAVTNTTTTYPAPFANWFTSQKQQFLYTAAELNAAGIFGGQINQLDWDVVSIPPSCITTFHEYTVAIGCTNLTTLSGPSFISGLTTVFPAQTITITVGWNSIVFPFGYYWDGVSNLIVQVCNSEGPPWPNYTVNALSSYTTTSYVSSLVDFSDSQDQCTTFNSSVGTGMSHPSMRLHYCPAVSNPSAFSYLWSPLNGNIANDTLQYTTAQPSAPTSYIVTVTNIASGCYKKDTVNVTFLNPVANFTMVPDSTNAYNYWAFNTTMGTGINYSWNFGDGSALSTAFSPTHQYSSAGTYQVCLTITYGNCTNTLCQTVVVTGTLNPCLALFNIAHDTTSSNPNAYTVTNLSYGSTLTYLWSFGDTATSTLQFPSHIYAGTGPYQLCLTVDNGTGCTQTYCDSVYLSDTANLNLHPVTINVVDAPTFGTTVKTQQLPLDIEDWVISPNPTTGIFIVKSENHKMQSIKITDILGNTIQKHTIINQQSSIDLSSESKGIYFVQITDENKNVMNRKIVVQ